MIASVAVVIIGMLLACYFFVIGIVFFITIAAIARIVARSVAGSVRVVAITVRVVLAMVGL